MWQSGLITLAVDMACHKGLSMPYCHTYGMESEHLRWEMGDEEYFERLEARQAERELMDR